jgi:glucose dehydrogenase
MRALKAPVLAVVAAGQTYAGDPAGTRYSPLDEINTTNLSRLKLA